MDHDGKGHIKPPADFCAVNSSKKTNERSWFLIAMKSKQAKKNCLHIFWENLQLTNVLTVLSDLYLA
mgnify:CR=1 FL=1